MATVDDVVKSLLGGLGTETDYLQAVKWVDERYKELVSRVRFNHLRRVGELRTSAAVDTGTVTVIQGSTNVAGVTTTWTTSPGVFATTTKPYWAFRGSVAWYEVNIITDDTNLVLSTAFSEDSVIAGGYRLVRRYYILNSSARWLGQFVHPRLGVQLGEPISPQELDSIDARRTLVGSMPSYVSVIGTTTTGNSDGVGIIMVEIYPYPSEAELIKYVYWAIPAELTLSSTLPPQIDGYILKEGAYIDYCRLMMAKREKEGKLESTAFWRNEMHAARTKWEYLIAQATKADRAADDVSFILERDSAHGTMGDITTARGHWLAGYTRP